MKLLSWFIAAILWALGANLHAQTNNQVFYLDASNTINKLSATSSTTWGNQNLGQLATGSTRLTSFTDNLGSHVFYQNTSSQINQLLGTGWFEWNYLDQPELHNSDRGCLRRHGAHKLRRSCRGTCIFSGRSPQGEPVARHRNFHWRDLEQRHCPESLQPQAQRD